MRVEARPRVLATDIAWHPADVERAVPREAAAELARKAAIDVVDVRQGRNPDALTSSALRVPPGAG